jgi:hypothetical protein
MVWIEGTEVERLTRKEERGRKGMNIGGEQPASRFSRIRLILVETRGICGKFEKMSTKNVINVPGVYKRQECIRGVHITHPY